MTFHSMTETEAIRIPFHDRGNAIRTRRGGVVHCRPQPTSIDAARHAASRSRHSLV